MAQQQESFLPFSSWQSLSCCLSRVARRSTPKPHGPLYSPSEPHGPLSIYLLQNFVVLPFFTCFRTSWFSLFTSPKLHDPLLSPPKPCGPLSSSEPRGPLSVYLLQNLVVLPLSLQNRVVFLFTPEPCGPLVTSKPRGPLPFPSEQRSPLSLWLPGLGLNPSAHLPLQPHF